MAILPMKRIHIYALSGSKTHIGGLAAIWFGAGK